MNEYEYEFVQDSKEKKNIGRNIKYKNGTGKGPLKFPSDYLTKKEKEKMNGPLNSYDMGKPMTYSKFKAMPDDLQKQYLQGMMDKFYPTQGAIAKLFGVSDVTVSLIMKRFNISPASKQGYHNKNFKREAWDAWIAKSDTEKEVVKETDISKESISKNTKTPVIAPVPIPVPVSKDDLLESLGLPTVSKNSNLNALSNTANLWSTFLSNKLMPLKAEDVAAMLAMLKLTYISSGRSSREDWKQLAEFASIAAGID